MGQQGQLRLTFFYLVLPDKISCVRQPGALPVLHISFPRLSAGIGFTIPGNNPIVFLPLLLIHETMNLNDITGTRNATLHMPLYFTEVEC